MKITVVTKAQHRIMWCSKNLNKISVVAEMGDRARAKWAEKWRGLLCPFGGIWRAGSPCNIMWPIYLPTKWNPNASKRFARVH